MTVGPSDTLKVLPVLCDTVTHLVESGGHHLPSIAGKQTGVRASCPWWDDEEDRNSD